MRKLLFWRHTPEQPQGPREYKPMAVSPQAHARIVELASRKGMTIIDTFDKLMGVK